LIFNWEYFKKFISPQGHEDSKVIIYSETELEEILFSLWLCALVVKGFIQNSFFKCFRLITFIAFICDLRALCGEIKYEFLNISS